MSDMLPAEPVRWRSIWSVVWILRHLRPQRHRRHLLLPNGKGLRQILHPEILPRPAEAHTKQGKLGKLIQSKVKQGEIDRGKTMTWVTSEWGPSM